MKLFKNTFLAALFFSYCMVNAQERSGNSGVEKSIFTVQTGAVGLWVSNEARLSNQFALRTEVGLDLYALTVVYNGTGKEVTDRVIMPSIGLEPRWYYNIEKRAGKGKYTANNSADFVTIAVDYISGSMAMSVDTDLEIPEVLTIIPKWGMRRSIAGSNFNYELGGGIGYQAYIANSEDMHGKSDIGIDVHLRIGYTF